jgi:cytochrome c biogenesis factor
MYPHLLATHNALRWAFLFFLVISLIQSYSGWFGNKSYTKSANTFKTLTVTTVHLQLLLGLVLYFVSPIVAGFLENVGAGMKEKDLRFFGMEHFIMMLIAVVAITVGSAKSKRQSNDTAKYKTVAIWFTIALVLVLLAAPSEFSPMSNRPNFRGF